MNQQKSKIANVFEDSFEKIGDEVKQGVKEVLSPFDPVELFGQLLGLDPEPISTAHAEKAAASAAENGGKRHSDLDFTKLQEMYKSQDQEEVAKHQQELGLKQRLANQFHQRVMNESEQAIAERKQEEQQRLQEEEQKKQEEEQQKRQAMQAAPAESPGKAPAHLGQARKKASTEPPPTMENSGGKGKQ
ncbi:hypothetical protein HGA88_01625 [Candidatus Roizmanbacteria bacterium]|nr:hypothetical protein [Candidatus Roizmanbacteria bacterium]